MSGVRHLYVHLPFCAARCGYCDFVTVVGRRGSHASYVEAVLGEIEFEAPRLAPSLDTVYVGGGTPTFTSPDALARLLEALPAAHEVTVEANPETVTPPLARLLRKLGVNRVSLGAQTFDQRLLDVLERRARPDVVRRAVSTLRGAGFDNISLDLIYGIPGQSSSDLERDLEQAIALEPDHLSCYELEAKPGTRFTHAWGPHLARQAAAMEGYFPHVVDTLCEAGYRWYETASFCLDDKRGAHNLAYWLGHDYLGVGIGAVSTVGMTRWRNRAALAAYIAALGSGRRPARDFEPLDPTVRLRERLMLGLRLDEPIPLEDVDTVLDREALDRLEQHGLAERRGRGLTLTPRGRLVGGGVTVELLAELPARPLAVA